MRRVPSAATNRALALAAVLLTAIALAGPAAAYADDRGGLWSKFLDLYTRIAILGRRGVDVSSLVDELATALELLEKGDPDSLRRAGGVLSSVEEKLSTLEKRADSIVLMESLRRCGAAGAILSIPVLFYILFPRLYLAIWFRARRRWVVER